MAKTSAKTTGPGAPATLKITLVRSPLGYSLQHKRTVRALGLRRLHQSVEHIDSLVIRGMVAKVGHLVKVEEVG